MVTKQGEKKKWLVIGYSTGSNHFLEDSLNRLAEDGYSVYQIDSDRQQIIAYLKEESSFLKLFGGPRKEAEEKKDEEDEDPLENYKPKNQLTNMLLGQLINIMEARGAGDPHTEMRVDSLIQHIMKRGSLNDAHGTADELLNLLELHKNHVAHVSSDKKPCSDNCSVNVVLAMAAAKLRAFLAKHPVS